MSRRLEWLEDHLIILRAQEHTDRSLHYTAAERERLVQLWHAFLHFIVGWDRRSDQCVVAAQLRAAHHIYRSLLHRWNHLCTYFLSRRRQTRVFKQGSTSVGYRRRWAHWATQLTKPSHNTARLRAIKPDWNFYWANRGLTPIGARAISKAEAYQRLLPAHRRRTARALAQL